MSYDETWQCTVGKFENILHCWMYNSTITLWARFTKQGKVARESNPIKVQMGVESFACDQLTTRKLKKNVAAGLFP